MIELSYWQLGAVAILALACVALEITRPAWYQRARAGILAAGGFLVGIILFWQTSPSDDEPDPGPQPEPEPLPDYDSPDEFEEVEAEADTDKPPADASVADRWERL